MSPIVCSATGYTPARGFWRATRAVAVTQIGVACGLVLLQACNTTDAITPLDPADATPVSLVVGTATVGTMLDVPVRLAVKRADGRPLPGATVFWTTRDGGVVSSSSTTDATGIAAVRWTLGTIAGPQSLKAEVPGLTPVVFGAVAVADRPATVRFAPIALPTRLLGDTVRLMPTVLDRWGNASGTAAVLSVETANDAVTLTGNLLLARRRGVAVIRATADTATARLTVVVDPLAPTVSRVLPDTIVPGATIAIDGANFALLADAAEVAIGGYTATITKISATHIDAVLQAESVPCQASSNQTVKVSVAGASANVATTLRVATRVILARGESANILDGKQVRCTEIVSPGGAARAKYVVAVINTSVTAAATSGFELRGTGAGAMAGQIALPLASSAMLASASRADAPLATVLPATLVSAMQGERDHDDHLDAQRALSSRYGSPAGAWMARRKTNASSGMAGVRASVGVGDTVVVKALYNSCSRGTDIRARVIYTGTRSVVLEDVAAPRAGQMDEQYRAIGDEFDRVQYPLLQSKIGDPLAMNSTMAGDGRVTMLFTRYVNDSLPGIAGYVTACNFYLKGTFAASNEDELFYARVASAGETPDDWRRSMRSTVIHEAKHLASFAERFVRNVPFEESWLEESTARIAEELYSRTFANGGAWKSNTGFTSVRCEVTRCDSRPLMMWKHFSVLHQYMRGVDTLTPIGAAASGDFTYYASGWSLVRWATDHYAADEGQWLKELVKGGPLTGLANLAQHTGRLAGDMLADWALAKAVDDLPGFVPRRAELAFPSWNVADVMSGLATAYPNNFVAAPLRARAMSFGSFTLPVARLRAFSSSYFSFEGPQVGCQVIELRGVGGAVLPAGTLRVAVVRVE